MFILPGSTAALDENKDVSSLFLPEKQGKSHLSLFSEFSELRPKGNWQQCSLHKPHWIVQGAVAQVAAVIPLQRQASEIDGSNKNAMYTRTFMITDYLGSARYQEYLYFQVI